MLDPKRVEEEIRPITMMLLDQSLEVKKEWLRELLMDLDAMMTWADQPGYESILQDVKETIERRFIRRSW